MDTRILVFLAVATLLTITPGADMALVTRNVLRDGLGAGLITGAGIVNGVVVWALLSAVGVAAIVAATATAFTALKLAGAAYLIYLGVMTLWRTRKLPAVNVDGGERPRPSVAAHYRQGLLSNLLNPKVGLFYTTLLPQFIAPGDSVFAWTLLLAAMHIVLGIVWLAFYAWLVTRVRAAVERPAIRRAMDRVTGTVLIGLGLRVAQESA